MKVTICNLRVEFQPVIFRGWRDKNQDQLKALFNNRSEDGIELVHFSSNEDEAFIFIYASMHSWLGHL